VPTPRVPDRRLWPHQHASPRPAGARLPATCPASAAVSVGNGGPLFTGVTYAIGGVFSAGDTDTAAEAPSYPYRDVGVPPSASSHDTRVMFTRW